MINIGEFNTLRAKRSTQHGWYLASPEDEEVLLPNKYVPEDFKENDLLEVFIYKDSEDRIVATTEIPYAIVGEFSNLEVKDVSQIGAFLDWGLEKDLLVPFREQKKKLEVGNKAVVFVYLDEQTGRIAASCKIDNYIEPLDEEYKVDEEVDLLIYRKTELGYEAIIDDHAIGLLYDSEIHQTIRIGDRLDGFISNIREDGKVDLRLQKVGMDHLDEVSRQILADLVAEGGFLPLHDKSSPEEIKKKLQISKKAFKKAIGMLYKQKMITIKEDGITAV